MMMALCAPGPSSDAGAGRSGWLGGGDGAGWGAGDHALAEVDVRCAINKVVAELLQLVLLRRGRRVGTVDELGPGQDQVVALELRLDDAGAVTELARDSRFRCQRGDEVVLADLLARVVRLVR